PIAAEVLELRALLSASAAHGAHLPIAAMHNHPATAIPNVSGNFNVNGLHFVAPTKFSLSPVHRTTGTPISAHIRSSGTIAGGPVSVSGAISGQVQSFATVGSQTTLTLDHLGGSLRVRQIVGGNQHHTYVAKPTATPLTLVIDNTTGDFVSLSGDYLAPATKKFVSHFLDFDL